MTSSLFTKELGTYMKRTINEEAEARERQQTISKLKETLEQCHSFTFDEMAVELYAAGVRVVPHFLIKQAY